jgi:hypothetical protein
VSIAAKRGARGARGEGYHKNALIIDAGAHSSARQALTIAKFMSRRSDFRVRHAKPIRSKACDFF